MKKVHVILTVIASALILWGITSAGASMQPPTRTTTTAPTTAPTAPQAAPMCDTIDYSGKTDAWSVFTTDGELVLIGFAVTEDSSIEWASEQGKDFGQTCLPD